MSWQFYSAWVCSDDNGSVHSVIWLLSAEYCQCQQRSGAPATEYDRRQPWNHPESGAVAADLSRFLRAKSRYQDTQSTIVFPLNNSSHSLFNSKSWSLASGGKKVLSPIFYCKIFISSHRHLQKVCWKACNLVEIDFKVYRLLQAD